MVYGFIPVVLLLTAAFEPCCKHDVVVYISTDVPNIITMACTGHDVDAAFNLLGIPRIASRREVDAAYRRAALRCHPDKPGGSTQEFHRVHAAYTVVTTTLPGRCPHDAIKEVPFAVHWMVLAAAAVATSACRAADVCIDLPVSLEDEFFGRVKKVVISVARWDNGLSALAKTTHTLFVPLAANTPEYTCCGVGDDPPIPWLMVMRQALPGCATKGRGGVRVSIKCSPHPVFYIDNVLCSSDLHTDVDVTPFDHYYGREVCIEHFDGLPPVVVNYSRKVGGVHIERGRGMPITHPALRTERGDLHIFFEIRLPDVSPERLEAPGVRNALMFLFAKGEEG